MPGLDKWTGSRDIYITLEQRTELSEMGKKEELLELQLQELRARRREYIRDICFGVEQP